MLFRLLLIIVKNDSDIDDSIPTLTVVSFAGMSRMTLEDDIAPRGDWLLSELSEIQRQQVISERAIALVASEVGELEIGKIMGFSTSKLKQYQGSPQNSVRTQVRSMCSDWRIKMSTKATVDAFVRLLREAKIEDEQVRTVITKEYYRPR